MKQISETQFQADWLSLREPADHEARDAALLDRAARCVRPGMRVLDLGSGTGSTARAFTASGFDELQWCFLDNDPALLQIASARHPMSECMTCSVADIDALPLEHVGLVTVSALLDLMSAEWVEALAVRLCATDIPFYAALSYDGVMRWEPPSAADVGVTEAFNRHQQSDKGLGTALGPTATKVTARAFEARGFSVSLADSPWVIGPDQAALHDAFVTGVGTAAAEAGAPRAGKWTAEKRRMLDRSRAFVGHTDFLAVPDAMRGATERDFRR